MAKATAFRFAIADDRPRSECWSLFISQNDVYLTSNAYKQVLKVSLHQSGICQVALLEDFFAQHVEWRKTALVFAPYCVGNVSRRQPSWTGCGLNSVRFRRNLA